jgi:two-component system cell cycle sensor histidine kinase/response regulator CckA
MVVGKTIDKTPAAACKEPLSKGTIVIVEDDTVVLQIAQRAIEACGYRVLTATTSLAADKILKAQMENIDLVLLDVVLPWLNGFQLFESWRKRHPQLRVLYMSGYMENAVVKNNILAHGLPFIQKPFTAEGLVLAMLKTLGEKNND